jgi:hypothetical protein
MQSSSVIHITRLDPYETLGRLFRLTASSTGVVLDPSFIVPSAKTAIRCGYNRSNVKKRSCGKNRTIFFRTTDVVVCERDLRVNLRLAVYRPSVHLGAKPVDVQDKVFLQP